MASESCGSRFCAAYRQFNALCRKNAILKFRLWWELLIELIVPILFMFALASIKGLFETTTNPQVIPEENPMPLPLMSHLLDHTEYPNVLCHDDNILYRCHCELDDDEELEDYVDYYGWMGFPIYHSGALYWNNMHHASQQMYGVCIGIQAIMSGLGYPLEDLENLDTAGVADLDTELSAYGADFDSLSSAYSSMCDPASKETDIDTLHSDTLYLLQFIEAANPEALAIAADDIDAACEKQALAIAPESNDDALNSIVSSFQSFINDNYPRLADFVETFESEADLEEHIQQNDYSQDASISPKIGSAIIFHAGSPNWDYGVRSNFTKIGLNYDYYMQNVPSTSISTAALLKEYTEIYMTDWNFEGIFNKMYMTSNNLAVQMLVDEFIFNEETGSGGALEGTSPSLFNIYLANFPSSEYDSNGFWASMETLFALFIVVGVMYPVLNMIKHLVQEKELKLKEGMRMMGLSATAHALSWLAHFTIFFVCLSILMAMMGAPLFEYSDGGLIFFYFLWFFMSSISYAFLISSFFNTAKAASVLGAMGFFVMLFPYFAVDDTWSVSSKTGLCLLPTSCFALGTDAFIAYEDAQIGVTSNTASSSAEGIPFNTVIGMLFFDFILYGVLAWYFNQIMPSEWGTNRKWYFLFTKSFWCPTKVGEDVLLNARDDLLNKDESTNNANVQAVSDDLKSQIGNGDCVAIRDLKKVFKTPTGDKIAVNDLNLTMYSGQITALLGHNGAGKTTTISMLTGMFSPTSGNAFVGGKHIGTQMKAIRHTLGVCPQHDILYPNLTVKEHLRMYAVFKGVPGKEINDAVNQMIKEVGLTEKVNARSKTLSGGQKRKLSVGIAFMGQSQVVFLDEPTSGMDPYSRRFTWDVIRRNREGRVIVLTTHFMDEADLLGDRIAIMADGQLKCCGSSLFLKSKFGVGYNLTLVKKMKNLKDSFATNPLALEAPKEATVNDETKDEVVDSGLSLCDDNALVALVRAHVPKFKLLSNVGAEISFQLPQNSSGSFKALLADLDGAMSNIGIETYGISVTTLEEVFIKVATGMHEEEVQRSVKHMKLQRERSKSSSLVRNSSKNHSDNDWKKERAQGFHLFLLHMKALLGKRLRSYVRDIKALVLTMVVPAIFLLIGLGILQISSDIVNNSISLDLASTYNTEVSQSSNPVPYVPSTNCSSTDCYAYFDSLMDEMVGATPVVVEDDFDSSQWDSTYDFNSYLLGTNDVYEASRYGAFSFLSDSDVVIHTNFTGAHAFPLFINALNEAVFRLLGGSGVSINVREFPLPTTSTDEESSDGADGFTVSLFLLIAFAFVPAGYAQYVLREKEMKTKHQQVVSGVSLNAYWLSNYLADLMCFILGPLILTLILLAAFDVTLLIDGKGGECSFVLLLLYGLAVIPWTYLFTFLFKKAAVGTAVSIFANWILNLGLPIVGFMLYTIPSTRDSAEDYSFFFRLFPQYCFGHGFLMSAFRTWFYPDDSPFKLEITGYDMIFLAWEIPVFFILILCCERVFTGSNPLAQKLDNLRLKAKGYQRSEIDPALIDEDVRDEAERVDQGGAVNDVIRIQNLRKAFPNPPFQKGCKEAVKGMTLGIPRGECFGLLGINGAGKTTTLSMLSGEQPPSEGVGILNGLDIAMNAEEVHRLVGYCPQFDAIFSNLSGRENLRIYGRLKGIPEHRLEDLVEKMIKQMNLTEYADRICGSYSGGNKRKLSVGIAMIGGPELIFLDEPSTGMDPVARRFMWDIITRISTERAECAIILTTHSMEECEALCTRIGIMVGGHLRCLGSAQHLKSRFGLGFQLELGFKLPDESEVSGIISRLPNASQRLDSTEISQAFETLGLNQEAWLEKFSDEGSAAILHHELAGHGTISLSDFASFVCLETRSLEAEDFVFSSFEGAIVREKQSGKSRFEFPAQNMSLGHMFGLLEDNRLRLKIEEYSLSQTTLEQIFNHFASQQEEETGQAAGIMGTRSTARVQDAPQTESSSNPQENL